MFKQVIAWTGLTVGAAVPHIATRPPKLLRIAEARLQAVRFDNVLAVSFACAEIKTRNGHRGRPPKGGDVHRSNCAVVAIFAGVLLWALSTAGLCGTAWAAESFALTQLTTNTDYDGAAEVSGDRVVWYGMGGSDGGTDTEIFTWTPGGGVVQLTTNLYGDDMPQVSGDRVVWCGTGGSDGGTDMEVFTWTPGGGVVQLTLDSKVQEWPWVSGDRVVWCGAGDSDAYADREIFTWTPGGGVVQLTTNAYEDAEPKLSGDRVVWMGRDGADSEIFTWTPTGGTTQITINSGDDFEPRVSGDRVVWTGRGGPAPADDLEIFTWTPTGGIVQISVDDLTDDEPSVSGERVVWSSHGMPWSEIMMWTPTGGIVRLSGGTYTSANPQVSGNRVVWTDSADGDPETITWTPTAGLTQISTNSDQDRAPMVSGDRVVWLNIGGADPNYEIYTAVPRLAYTSIRGTHRYHTAQLISQAMFPGGLPAYSGLVLAPGETFQEALCGAPLAAAVGGPVLLTPSTGLENGTRAEMLRLDPYLVFCIGLSGTVVGQVQTALGDDVLVIPINGANVYDMSYRVAKMMEIGLEDMSDAMAIITVGNKFPDAIGVSPLACAKLWPILLTEGPTAANPNPVLNPKAAQALSELGITQAIKVGTYVKTPAAVNYYNLSGADRYYTNANVAKWAQAYAGLTFTHTGLATGDKFPDALAAGPFLANDGGLLLLTPLKGPVPPPIVALLTTNRTAVKRFSYIAMIEPVLSQVKGLLK